MPSPDQRLFEEDVASAEFQIGADKRFWGMAPHDSQLGKMVWPKVVFWIAAPPRANAPDRFHIRLDLTGYRTASPTGSFWNPVTDAPLDTAHWPKGKSDSRLAKVFRVGWNNAVFYHPYDRVAAQSHPQWPVEQPHLIWTAHNTIIDYLAEFHSLLNGEDYIGV